MIGRLRGLYAITPDPWSLWGSASGEDDRGERSWLDGVARAMEGGARLVQYRDKSPEPDMRRRRAGALLDLCRSAGVPLIVNDDLELALALGADGVHLGREDGDAAAARARLGPGAILGVSCYDRLELAIAAERAGASYAAFGSFFPSKVKPGAVRPEPDLLTRARERMKIPLVAIGGITTQNAASLIAAGADMLAVVTGLFQAPDIAAAARDYAQLFAAGDRPMEPDQ
jgi:thiamine-phosphate pyrophosphorylase